MDDLRVTLLLESLRRCIAGHLALVRAEVLSKVDNPLDIFDSCSMLNVQAAQGL